MKMVKGFTKKVNGGRNEFISEDEFNKLLSEYKNNIRVIEETEDYAEYSICDEVNRNRIVIGWAFYPQFN